MEPAFKIRSVKAFPKTPPLHADPSALLLARLTVDYGPIRLRGVALVKCKAGMVRLYMPGTGNRRVSITEPAAYHVLKDAAVQAALDATNPLITTAACQDIAA